ncbi:MAG: hypothetical protein NTV14_10390 [Coprothermobacterota bacterium]|nr:hypothetical protein [Coprothermobacterota bacterium]
MKRFWLNGVVCLLVLLLAGSGLALGSTMHPIEHVSPISDASWVQIPFDNGIGSAQWETDKGPVQTDGAKIIDGLTYVPFRWAVELFGGSATWSNKEDGSTDAVYFYAPGADIPTTPTGTAVRRPLSTIVYNWIPNLDEYLSTMEKDFEAAYPEIDLTIMNLPDYYGDPYGVLVNQADVYECDEGMLPEMIAADKLQPLAASEVPNPDDFLQICKDVAVKDGTWWGIPHWTCTDFMFYNKNDTELAAATTFSKLEAAIGGKDHPLGQGLLVQFMGYRTVNYYKDCLMDLYKDDPATYWSYVDKDNVNMQVVGLMKRMIALEDPGIGRNALNAKISPYLDTQFVYGNGRATVYYSEGLGYMADIIDNAQNAWFDTTLNLEDIAIMPFIQADTPVSASTGYVDSFCLDKSLTGQKRADALTFAQWVTSTKENVRQVAPPDGSTVRYLSPARMSVYTDPGLLAVAPLYKSMLPAMQRGRYFLPPADLDETGLEDKLNELLPFN